MGRPRVSAEGRWIGAVLAAGEGAALSHRAAGAHWGILRTARPAIEVTVPRRLRSRTGLEGHWAQLPPDEVTVLDGIPITTVPRTIFDLAAVERASRVESAFNEAEVRQLTDPLSLNDLLLRYPRALRVGKRLIEADCVWLEQKAIVELDGRATHGTARAFESDRARDRALTVRRWRVIRVTWRQLHGDPAGLAADLRVVLGLRAAA